MDNSATLVCVCVRERERESGEGGGAVLSCMPKKLLALCLSCQSGAEFKVLCPGYLSCQYCIRSWLLVIRARNKNIILLLGMDVGLFPGRNDRWQSARGIDDLCPECNLWH